MARGHGFESTRFDQRNELHHPGADFAGEEPVDIQRPLHVQPVEDRQGVEVDLVFFQQLGGGKDPVEGGLASLGHAVGVVELFGPSMLRPTRKWFSRRNRHQGSSRSRPLVCRLLRTRLCGGQCFFCSSTTLRKKSTPNRGRLAALPLEFDLGCVVVGDVVADELFQHVVGHGLMPAEPQQPLLAEVIAVGASEVAGRAERFGHDVEAPLALDDGDHGHVALSSSAMRSRFKCLWCHLLAEVLSRRAGMAGSLRDRSGGRGGIPYSLALLFRCASISFFCPPA